MSASLIERIAKLERTIQVIDRQPTMIGAVMARLERIEHAIGIVSKPLTTIKTEPTIPKPLRQQKLLALPRRVSRPKWKNVPVGHPDRRRQNRLKGLRPGNAYYIISHPRTKNGRRLYYIGDVDGIGIWDQDGSQRVWFPNTNDANDTLMNLKTPNRCQLSPRYQNGPCKLFDTGTPRGEQEAPSPETSEQQ